MIVCDTGPLVALIDRDDPHHARCAAALRDLPRAPLLTTWACFTEAMYLLRRAGGLPAQDTLWQYVVDGVVVLATLDSSDAPRMRALMHKYADAPMDLADASVVALADARTLRRVFTLDRHFHAYRTTGGHPFELVPV